MLFNPRKRKERSASDFGRRYGWSVLSQGSVVAELTYESQAVTSFFHHYQVIAADDQETVRFQSLSPVDWMAFALQNRKYTAYVSRDFYVGRCEAGMVSSRGLFLPDAFYR